MIPSGGKSLLQMRIAGKRPPGFIVVTEDRKVAAHFRNPLRSMHVLMFQEGKDYDWRLLKSLDVGLITRLPRDKVAPICAAIFAAEPSRFHAHYQGLYETEHDWIINAAR